MAEDLAQERNAWELSARAMMDTITAFEKRLNEHEQKIIGQATAIASLSGEIAALRSSLAIAMTSGGSGPTVAEV